MIESAKSAATTQGDGSNDLIGADAKRRAEGHESQVAQFAYRRGDSDERSGFAPASLQVRSSEEESSVAALCAIDDFVCNQRCTRYGHCSWTPRAAASAPIGELSRAEQRR